MPIAIFGGVAFDIANDLQTIQHDRGTSFARHAVLGTSPVYEHTGEEESTVTLSGTMHPFHFGGVEGIALLETARQAHLPLPLMRGDGTPVGWFLLQSLTREEADLDQRQGLGQEIQWTAKLLRTGAPTALAESVLRLFMS